MNKVGETSTRYLAQGEALRKAVVNNQLVLYYLPIIDIETGNLKGAEVILRWNHSEFGLLSPSKFFSLVYENGLTLDIGKWMLKQACIQAKLWHEIGYEMLSITVGISFIEFDQSQFVKNVKEVLGEVGLPPYLLELGIAESFLQQTEFNTNSLEELGDLGVQFSIDNYGIGGSSIKSLKKLPIKSLKLDASLTSDLGPDTENFAIVTAINALAKKLGFLLSAENVDTEEQLKLLYEAQCDYAQGKIISKPINAEDFLKLLEQRKTGTLA